LIDAVIPCAFDFFQWSLPTCDEGYMPLLKGARNLVFDKAGFVKEPEPSEVLENERRLFYVAVTRAKKGILISTSKAPTKGSQGKSTASRPSRFLFEIQREPTAAVLGPLQRLAAGEAGARSEIQGQVAAFGGIKPVVRNLCEVYLPGIGEASLARQLASIAERQPEVLFTYPEWLAQPLSKITAKPDSSQQRSEPRWWEREEEDYYNSASRVRGTSSGAASKRS
jgi:UvrD-like helicase C-terminal domain